MKTRLFLGLAVSFTSPAHALVAPIHFIYHAKDLPGGDTVELYGQPLHVKARVSTNKTFSVSRTSTITVDQDAYLAIGGGIISPTRQPAHIYKRGAGDLVLASPFSLNGHIILQEGGLKLAHLHALDSGIVGVNVYAGTRLEYVHGLNVNGQLYFKGDTHTPVRWHIDSGRATQLGDVHGEGVIHKTGVGELHWPLGLRNNFEGVLVVQEGILSLASEVPADIVVFAQLHAQDALFFNLHLHPNAMLQLKGHGGSGLRVRQALVLEPDSQTMLRIWADGRHDFLQANRAIVNGRLQIVAQDDDWNGEQVYTIITTKEALHGHFQHMEINRHDLQAQLQYSDKELLLRVKRDSITGLRHPYNAILSSLADDSMELARLQNAYRPGPNTPGWWGWTQHKGQHHIRLASQPALERHAEWMVLGYNSQDSSNAGISWALASSTQRWRGIGQHAGHASKAQNVQMGVSWASRMKRWSTHAGFVVGVHHLRHEGSQRARAQKLISQHLHAQIDYQLWHDMQHSLEAWARWDSLKLPQAALSLSSGTTLRPQGQWQHQPGLGLRWEWNKKSWPRPARIQFELGWQASPATQRSHIQTAQGRTLKDQSPFQRGSRWNWAVGVQSQLNGQDSLSLRYLGHYSRQAGPDHGIGIQYQSRF